MYGILNLRELELLFWVFVICGVVDLMSPGMYQSYASRSNELDKEKR